MKSLGAGRQRRLALKPLRVRHRFCLLLPMDDCRALNELNFVDFFDCPIFADF